LDDYNFWRFVHILLFVYWLGGDLGVYLAAKYVARKDLRTDERRRFLDLTLYIDMGPRTALILLPAVGFQLATVGGYMNIRPEALAGIWILTGGWLALMWFLFLRRGEARIAPLRQFDAFVRYAVLMTMATLGIVSLVTSAPIADAWLSAKIILYAAAIADGLYLRHLMAAWERGFELIESGRAVEDGNALIARASVTGERFGLLMWLILAAIGYLGAVKPF
jgi:hypothetical protein